jgi:hypothetical protein
MRALLALCFLMFSTVAHAEVDLKTFLENYDGADIAEKHHFAERLSGYAIRNGVDKCGN